MEDAPPSFEQCLERYREQHLAARDLAAKTRREYLNDLAQLLAFLTDGCNLSSPTGVERRHLEGFLAELGRRVLRGSSRRRKVASATSFLRYRPERDTFGPLLGPPFTAASPAVEADPTRP